jgi:hypothetical protein
MLWRLDDRPPKLCASQRLAGLRVLYKRLRNFASNSQLVLWSVNEPCTRRVVDRCRLCRRIWLSHDLSGSCASRLPLGNNAGIAAKSDQCNSGPPWTWRVQLSN